MSGQVYLYTSMFIGCTITCHESYYCTSNAICLTCYAYSLNSHYLHDTVCPFVHTTTAGNKIPYVQEV